MSAYHSSPSFPQYPAPAHPHSSRDDEPKANYDDLIDQYTAPYGNQSHKTYAVDPRHGRQPSYPLSMSKDSYDTSRDLKSIDSHGRDPPDWEYPPPLAKEDTSKDEKESKWSRVRLPDHVTSDLS